MPDGSFQDVLARLEKERLAADRRYNEALTAVDHALHAPPVLPAAVVPFDETRLADVNRHWNVLPDEAPAADRSLKGRLRAFVWRVVGRALESQQQFNGALVDHLNRNTVRERDLSAVVAKLREKLDYEFAARSRFESLLVQYLQTITAYVDTKDRSAAGPELRQRLALTEERIFALKRELESQPRHQPSAPVTSPGPFSGQVDSLTYVGFEDLYRGSREDIGARVEAYVPLLETASDVVDIGCGRGELLDALRARGVTARGVDVNEAMVETCRARGLEVELADALTYLQRQRDGSIGGLVAIQVVEHFEPAYLLRVLETAYHKMRQRAPLVLETINPACWFAFFEAYIRDITHVRPLHPQTLKYLVQASGFADADIHFRRPVPERDRLEMVVVPERQGLSPEIQMLANALNAHAAKLNSRLFSDTDYVLVARRGGGV